MTKNTDKSGNARPAVLLGVLLLLASMVTGYALNYVKYSDSSYWTDADGIVVDTITVATTITLPADSIAAADVGVIAQSDTNATTTVTSYTPDFIGQALVGNSGGTNYIWLAYGTTTNDWKLVHP